MDEFRFGLNQDGTQKQSYFLLQILDALSATIIEK